jgi:uncharacterized OB-fold protein
MSSLSVKKPEPNIDADIAPFWEGVANERFLLVQCTDCQTWYWPFAYCKECPGQPFGENMKWTDASGLGTIFAVNVHRVAFEPSFKDDIPFLYAMIELDEGPMFGTNVINCEIADVQVGRRIKIVYVRNNEDGHLIPKAELLPED